MPDTRRKLDEIERYAKYLTEPEAMHARHLRDEMPPEGTDLEGANHARLRGDVETLHLKVTGRVDVPTSVATDDQDAAAGQRANERDAR